MGKTTQTIQEYLNRGQKLWLRCAKLNHIPHDELQPSVFLSWLESILPTLRPASRRQYIAASKEWLNSIKPENVSDEVEWAKSMHRVSQMQSRHYSDENLPPSKLPKRTSTQKMKRFNLEEFLTICKRTHLKSKWKNLTMLMLGANTLVGLRPGEWRTARLSVKNGRTYLLVKNAKHSNGRSHGEFRHIDITDFRKPALSLIKSQVESSSQHAEDDNLWSRYINAIRNTTYRILRKEKPGCEKYPSLYSSRHQFAADAKASGLAAVEIAAMLGHAVDETVKMHYGRKVHGDRKCQARPMNQDVTRVVQKESRHFRRKKGKRMHQLRPLNLNDR